MAYFHNSIYGIVANKNSSIEFDKDYHFTSISGVGVLLNSSFLNAEKTKANGIVGGSFNALNVDTGILANNSASIVLNTANLAGARIGMVLKNNSHASLEQVTLSPYTTDLSNSSFGIYAEGNSSVLGYSITASGYTGATGATGASGQASYKIVEGAIIILDSMAQKNLVNTINNASIVTGLATFGTKGSMGEIPSSFIAPADPGA